MLPLTSTHHLHLRGHSASAHLHGDPDCLVIGLTAPGEIVNDVEICLHGIGVTHARALGQAIVDACEKIEPTIPGPDDVEYPNDVERINISNDDFAAMVNETLDRR